MTRVFLILSFVFSLQINAQSIRSTESDLFKEGLEIAKKSKAISDPQFLSLNHFGKSARWYDLLWTQGILPRPYRNKNQLEGEIFERDQLDSRREVFAKHYELFFSNPEYPCRYPANARFMHQLLSQMDMLPIPKRSLEEMQAACGGLETRIFVDEVQPFQRGQAFVVNIAPERVYAIDYFHASKGSALMSRWGHSMVRLVVCNPERKVVNSDCEADVAYHVVLSYRASQDDYGRDQIKGVIGGYPSKLFALTLLDVLDEYNKEELRDLEIHRLTLSDEQKTRAIESILESYWNYIGNYVFFTNNCSHETSDLLTSFYTSEELRDHKKRIKASTPLQLRRRLTQGDYLSPTHTKFPGDLKFVENTLDEMSNFLETNKAQWIIKFNQGIDSNEYSKEFVSSVKSLQNRTRVSRLGKFLLKTSPKMRGIFYRDSFDVLRTQVKQYNATPKEKEFLFVQWRSRFMALENRALVALALDNRKHVEKLIRDSGTFAALQAKKAETTGKFENIRVKHQKPGVPLANEFDGVSAQRNAIALQLASVSEENYDSDEYKNSVDPYVVFRRKLAEILKATDVTRKEIAEVKIQLLKTKNLL